MANNFERQSEYVETALAAQSYSGEPVKLPSGVVGIAADNYVPGQIGRFFVMGVWRLRKATGATAEAGAPVFWDSTNRQAVFSGGTFQCGIASKPGISGRGMVVVDVSRAGGSTDMAAKEEIYKSTVLPLDVSGVDNGYPARIGGYTGVAMVNSQVSGLVTGMVFDADKPTADVYAVGDTVAWNPTAHQFVKPGTAGSFLYGTVTAAVAAGPNRVFARGFPGGIAPDQAPVSTAQAQAIGQLATDLSGSIASNEFARTHVIGSVGPALDGEFARVNGIAGIVENKGQGNEGIRIEGEGYNYLKVNAEAITAGQALYWSTSLGRLTVNPGAGDYLAATAMTAASAGSNSVMIRLLGKAPSVLAATKDVAAGANTGNGAVSVTSYGADMTGAVAADSAFAAAETAATGGQIVVPKGTPALSTFEPSKPGTWVNNSGQYLSTFLYNAGEAPFNTKTRNLEIHEFRGQNRGKRRFGKVYRAVSDGAGEVLAVDGSADFGIGVNVTKKNFHTPAAGAGELDGMYIVVRNGGDRSDTGAILMDVASYGNDFLAQTEGSTAKLGSAGEVERKLRVQTGVIHEATDEMHAFVGILEQGNATDGLQIQVQPGATATNYARYLNLNSPYQPVVYALVGDGSQVRHMMSSIGTAPGSVVTTDSVSVQTDSVDTLKTNYRRVSTGGGWETAEWQISRDINGGALWGGMFIRSGPAGSLRFGFSALDSLTFLECGTDNTVGFNGAAPVGKATLNAEATDAASTMALVNQIRAALIALGLAQ